MDKLVKILDIEKETKKVEDRDTKLRELCKNVYDNKPKIVDKIKKLFPSINFLDCHKVRAVLQDLKRAGKLSKIIQATPSKKPAGKRSKKAAGNKENQEETKGDGDGENIPPNQSKTKTPYYVGVEALRGRKRKSKAATKRREALTKRGTNKEPNQMSLDTFLVPKKRKKVENSQLLMMGCSDSFS